MSFETVALFPGSCLIKFKTSFLEIVSKEKVSLPKFSFIFLQLFSFSKFIFPVDSRRFKPLVIFVKYSLKVLEIFLLLLRVSFFSVKIMLLLVLHLSVKKGSTVSRIFQNQLFHLCLQSQRMSFSLTSVYSNRYYQVAYNLGSFLRIFFSFLVKRIS